MFLLPPLATWRSTQQCEWLQVDQLADKGVSASDIKKLKEAGFHTAETVHMTTKRTLLDIKGLSEAKVEKILLGAQQICTKGSFITRPDLKTVRTVHYNSVAL